VQRRWVRLVGVVVLALGLPHGASPVSIARRAAQPAPAAPHLHVAGNQIVATDRTPVVLHGVSRSGAEYACVNGFLPGAHDPPALFDGPMDDASVRALSAWHITAVRLPLNEDCWLGLNGIPASVSGATYRAAIVTYVRRLLRVGLTPILTLHEAAPARLIAIQQIPMPDADHSPAFWTSVARTFGRDTRIVFDLFDEPFPDNQQDSAAAWRCWRDGGAGTTATGAGPCRGVTYRDARNRDTGIPYRAASMQALVDAVRGTGARNVLALDGVAYADSLARWARYAPHDPLHALVAGWHPYSFNACAGHPSCWDATVAPLAAQVPVLLTEMGEDDCSARYIDRLMAWADRHGLGYLAWTWNTPDHAGCRPNGGADGDIFVIASYDGRPFPGMGVGFKAHLAHLAHLAQFAAGRPRVRVGRRYPAHTGIVATTFWVGEIFDPHAADGSQVTSTYDAHWMTRYGGCDGVIAAGVCATERRTAANGYFPTRMTPRQNPFYLDLPFDDVNNAAAFRIRAQVIPWAHDPGYGGQADDPSFSYMKNRWVALTHEGHTCYGQIEDAGPGQYADARYVFGRGDGRPTNTRYNGAGLDVSPALNGCLGFADLNGDGDRVNWRFVDRAAVPAGPWTQVITTSGVANS